MSFISSLGHAITGAVGGLVTGGPFGAIAGAVHGFAGSPSTGIVLPGGGQMVNAGMGISVPSPYGNIGLGTGPGSFGYNPMNAGYRPFSPGGPGTGIVQAGGGGIQSPLGTNAKVPAGYHVNKTIVRADVMMRNRGGLTPGMQRAMANVQHAIVKNRHTNPLNPRALRRAEGRAHGFLKFASKVVKHYRPHAPKGKAYIRTRKRGR